MLEKVLADKLSAIAVKQRLASQKFKQPRLDQIKKYEDAYNNVVQKALPGEFNIPIPVLGGFVDTLQSKIDNPPKLKFSYQDEADFKKSLKISALWEKDSSSTRGKWGRKDRNTKKLATFSGVGINKYFAESDPEYKSNLFVVDYYSFHCEPNGGSDLDNHLFVGEDDIFKTKFDLEAGAAAGRYDVEQVKKLTSMTAEDRKKFNLDQQQNKNNRFLSLGLDAMTNNYVGDDLYNLTEWYLINEGVWYYLLFDPMTGLWVSAEELKKKFRSGLQPYTAWHTHEDEFNFWNKGPCDDVYPIHEAIRININATLTNLNKRNKGMTAYDPDIFTEAAMLEWRANGLVPAFAKATGRPISESIYQFQTPDTTSITVNLTEFFDNFIGRKTGITPDAQGQSNEKMVGIYYGNMQQVADRLGLYNKYYTESHADLGLRYQYGVQEHVTPGTAVKLLGTRGAEWAEVTRDDAKPYKDFEIQIIGADAEAQADQAKKERRKAVLDSIVTNQILLKELNIKKVNEELLRNGDFDEEEIKEFMDKDHYSNKEIMGEAALAIKEILLGESPKQYRGATTAFIQKILDYATDEDVSDEEFKALTEYAQSHLPVAQENLARKAAAEIRQMKTATMLPGAGAPAGGSMPAGMPTMPGGGMPPEPAPMNPTGMGQDMANIPNVQ